MLGLGVGWGCAVVIGAGTLFGLLFWWSCWVCLFVCFPEIMKLRVLEKGLLLVALDRVRSTHLVS